MGENVQGPSPKHWLGMDKLGRDLDARIVNGSRKMLTLAPFSVLLSTIIGGTLSATAGYMGGLFAEVIKRGLDSLVAIPDLLLFLVIIAAFGQRFSTLCSRLRLVASLASPGTKPR